MQWTYVVVLHITQNVMHMCFSRITKTDEAWLYLSNSKRVVIGRRSAIRSQLRGQRAKLVVKIISLKSTHRRPYLSAMQRVRHVVLGSTLSDLTDNHSPGINWAVEFILLSVLYISSYVVAIKMFWHVYR